MAESRKEPSKAVSTSPTTTQDQKCPEGSQSLALKELKGKDFLVVSSDSSYPSRPVAHNRVVRADHCICSLDFVIRNVLNNLCCYVILLKGMSLSDWIVQQIMALISAPGFKNHKAFTHLVTSQTLSYSPMRKADRTRKLILTGSSFLGMRMKTGSTGVVVMSSGSSR